MYMILNTLNRKTLGESFFFLFFSAVLVTLFSTCSPLYPFNPWMDANVFMTIGKNMLHGMMPYRDLFDLKGILLFLVHEWAAFFCPHSFHAVYILQVLCLWGFLVYSHKTAHLFCKTSITLPFVCLTALLTISSEFYYYGDSVEEFSLPFLAHCMYHGLRFVRDGKIPSRWTAIVVGIGIGIILWMKYSILTFYFGALIAVLWISYKRAELGAVVRTVMWIVCGIMIVTIPVLTYALCHGILADFIGVYFYSNIFEYHGVSTREEMSWQEKTFPLVGYAVVLAVIGLSTVRKDVRLFVFCTFAGLASVLAFFKIPVCNFYYYLVLAVFLPLLIRYMRGWHVSWGSLMAFAAVALAASLLNYNLMRLAYGNFRPKVLDIAEIVNGSGCGHRDVLLYRCGDKGLFVLTDQMPAVKHFFSVGVAHIQGEEEEQEAYLASKKARYVVTADVLPESSGYTLIYEEQDDPERMFLMNPCAYLWNLGYPQCLLRHFMAEPQQLQAYLRLYERKQ